MTQETTERYTMAPIIKYHVTIEQLRKFNLPGAKYRVRVSYPGNYEYGFATTRWSARRAAKRMIAKLSAHKHHVRKGGLPKIVQEYDV